MLRYSSLIKKCTFALFCWVFFFYASNFLKYSDKYTTNETRQVTNIDTISIDDILNFERHYLATEMRYVEFPLGNYSENLDEFIPEKGGNPIRSVIISSWRSGSTFLGELLDSVPGSYYHHEPLYTYKIVKIRGPPHDKNALKVIKKLLKCDYTNMQEYLKFAKKEKALFDMNSRLWNVCRWFPNICYQPKFLGSFCSLFPSQSMKVLRLSLKVAGRLLEDSRYFSHFFKFY